MTSTVPVDRADRFTLAAVAIAKNEASYIEEWLAYHRVVGVDHVFLYDNDSTDDLDEVLAPYVTHGLVTLLRWPVTRGQVSAYRHAHHFFGHSARWLAFIDIDEFIVPTADPDVPTVLERVDPAQLVMPWRRFGFGGHRKRPPGLVIENYRHAQDIPPDGLPAVAVKSIVKPAVVGQVNVHLHRLRSGESVDGRGEPVRTDGLRMHQPRYDVLQVNHYFTKSEEEFATKLARGPGSGSPPMDFYGVDQETGFDTVDSTIERFVEPTRALLGELRALAPRSFRYGSLARNLPVEVDQFTAHARRAVSNYLHRRERPSNAHRPVEDLGDRRRSVVVAVPDGDEHHLFSSSAHAHDLRRRLNAVDVWDALDPDAVAVRTQSCAITAGDDGLAVTPHESVASFCLPTGDASVRRYDTALAVVDIGAPARIEWRAVPPTDPPVTTSLPRPGRYVVVVQAEAVPQRTSAVEVCVDSTQPILFRELTLIRYG